MSQEKVLHSLLSFLFAPNWDEKRKALHDHPLLLEDEVLLLLGRWLRTPSDEDEYDLMQPVHLCNIESDDGAWEPLSVERIQLVLGRMILEDCRTLGIAAALDRFAQNIPLRSGPDGQWYVDWEIDPNQIGTMIEDWNWEDLLILHDLAAADPQRIPELMSLCRLALTSPSTTKAPEKETLVHYWLGMFIRNYPEGNIVRCLHEAKHHLQAALETTPDNHPRLRADIQNELGLVYLNLPTGDRREQIALAINCFQEALRYRTPDNGASDYAAAQHNLGMAISNREESDQAGNLRLAAAHFAEALRFFTPSDHPEEYAKTSNSLGTIYLELSKLDLDISPEEAIPYFKQALHVWKNGHPNRSIGLLNLGQIYATLGPSQGVYAFEQAETCFSEILKMPETLKNRRLAARTHRARGNNFLNWSKTDKDPTSHGEQAFRQFLKARELLPVETNAVNEFPEDVRDINLALGDLAFGYDNWEAATAFYREAEIAIQTLYRITVADISRRHELGYSGAMYQNLAYCWAHLGEYAVSVACLEAGRARLLWEALGLTAVDPSRLAPDDRAQFAELRQRVHSLDAQIRALQGTALLDPADEPFLATYSTELREAWRTLRAILDRNQVQQQPKMLGLEAIQAASLPNHPLVYLATTLKGSLAFRIPPADTSPTAEDMLWLDDFATEDLEHLLLSDEVAYLLAQSSGDPYRMKAALDRALPVLQEALMLPLGRFLQEKGVQKATLVPSGLLAVLPLAAADPHGIVYSLAPSAGALLAAQAAAGKRTGATMKLLAVGNPLPHPRPLRAARVEAEQISRFFPAGAQTVLLEEEATLDRLLASGDGATHLHFSCHGQFQADVPLNSALSLADEAPLTLGDILNGRIDLAAARLVVLSACQTGLTEFRRLPDEAIGFPAAFMQTGVPGIVSSFWSVDDRSTALLMIHFYRYLLEDRLPPDEALHRAQLRLRDTKAADPLLLRLEEAGRSRDPKGMSRRRDTTGGGEHPFNHPYYWAGFGFTGA